MTETNQPRLPGRRASSSAFELAALILLVAATPARVEAQSQLLSGFNPFGSSPEGLHLYNVTGFVGWESVVSPPGGLFPAYSSNLKGDEMFGGGANLGWTRSRRSGSISISYNATYSGLVRYSSLSALNQSLSLSTSRQLSSKFTLGFAASSSISTYDQMLFTPTVFSSIAAAPGTFDDLASAVLAGKYNNDQLASLLTGAPMIESPSRTYFFGNRVFGSSGSVSLGYSHSQRLSINVSVVGGEAQHLKESSGSLGQQNGYLIPRAITAGAGVSASYSITPRTYLGVSMSTNRGFSVFQEAYTTSGSVSLTRTVGRHWFAGVNAGGGFVANLNSRYPSNIGTTPVYGGNVAYRGYAHTFMAAYGRTLGQAYGVGAANTYTTSVAWQWQRPGRHWGLSSSYMRQQLSNGIFGDVTGWRTSFGVNRRLGDHMVLETSYSYSAYSGQATPNRYDGTQNAVRASVMWSPRPAERR